jgi:hypothetical protein
MKTLIAPGCLIFILTACGPATPTRTVTPAISLTSTQRPNATLAQTSSAAEVKQPRPTVTRPPTQTPTQAPTTTSTPGQIPTKQVLLQYGVFGGDGGSDTDFYLGRDVPQLVLYTDGQLLLKQKQGDWFTQTTLTTSQMCDLLLRIERTGFFAISADGSLDHIDPIYAFGGTPQFSGDGTPEYLIQINGKQHKFVMIEPGYAPYLIQPVKTALQIVEKYSPETQLTPFKTKYLTLWIEKGLENAPHVTTQASPQPWPTQLPSLRRLLGDKNDGQAFIEDKDIAPILKLFGNRPGDVVFEEDGQIYYVIARPLLPHETPTKFSVHPSEDTEFDLPFTCP